MSKPLLNDTFSLSTRRNRLSYSALQILLIIGFLALLHGLSQTEIIYTLRDTPTTSFLFSIPFLVLQCILAAQRFRDLNITGWTSLFLLLPLLNTAAVFFLMILPGTPGDNRYGPDPRLEGNPLSLFLQKSIIALLLLGVAVLVLAILAFIGMLSQMSV